VLWYCAALLAAACVVPEMAAAQPNQPTGLTAKPGFDRVMLYWNDPGDSSIIRNEFRQKLVGNPYGPWTRIQGLRRDTGHLVHPLTRGRTYAFQVRAVNSTGDGPASVEVTATLLVKPTGFTATAGDGEITLSWNNPNIRRVGEHLEEQCQPDQLHDNGAPPSFTH
jgi:predicted RNA-binding protein with TRAM domain